MILDNTESHFQIPDTEIWIFNLTGFFPTKIYSYEFLFYSDEEQARNVPPNHTIMIRGLAQHITEADISDDIQSCGLIAKDIRLIRKKETGTVIKFWDCVILRPPLNFPPKKPPSNSA